MNPFLTAGIAIIILSLTLHGCKTEFRKNPSGLEYKIIQEGTGDPPKQGEFLKLQVKQYFEDTLLSDTRKTIAQYQPFDSAQMSKEAYEIFSHVTVGDSLVFRVPSDSAFKTSKPAFVKKPGWLTTHVKVEAIFRSDVEAKADLEYEKTKREPAGIGNTD